MEPQMPNVFEDHVQYKGQAQCWVLPNPWVESGSAGAGVGAGKEPALPDKSLSQLKPTSRTLSTASSPRKEGSELFPDR